MARLPGWIVKKFGVTKKAWAVFRGKHRNPSVSVSYKKHGGRKHMGSRNPFTLGNGLKLLGIVAGIMFLVRLFKGSGGLDNDPNTFY